MRLFLFLLILRAAEQKSSRLSNLLTDYIPFGIILSMSADNRTHLLNTALELFASRGYDAVGVQEIVEAAGVTKPTLYHYFGSKRGLLEALLETHGGELLAILREAAGYRHDLPHSLRQVMGTCFQFAQRHPVFYRMLLALRLSPPHSEAHQAASGLVSGQNEILETLFRQAAQDHGNMRGRQRAYAATFLGMVNTYIILSLSGDAVLDEELVTQALQQFSYGIYS